MKEDRLFPNVRRYKLGPSKMQYFPLYIVMFGEIAVGWNMPCTTIVVGLVGSHDSGSSIFGSLSLATRFSGCTCRNTARQPDGPSNAGRRPRPRPEP